MSERGISTVDRTTAPPRAQIREQADRLEHRGPRLARYFSLDNLFGTELDKTVGRGSRPDPCPLRRGEKKKRVDKVGVFCNKLYSNVGFYLFRAS